MICSIEISLYPLHPNYEKIVLEFIEFLDHNQLNYNVSGMSTLITGDLDLVFPVIQKAIAATWIKYGQASLVLKAIKTDVSSYEHKN